MNGVILKPLLLTVNIFQTLIMDFEQANNCWVHLENIKNFEERLDISCSIVLYVVHGTWYVVYVVVF